MKVSLCITIFNEEKGIKNLLTSLTDQNKKADEIVIIDGGSDDGTVDIVKKYKNNYTNIKLLIKKCTRSEGRNLSVKNAKHNIIAMTDADCIAKGDWLKKITSPFKDNKVGIVAGYYDMKCESSLQEAFSVFLGIYPDDLNENFLPSTRSIAFRKDIWKKIGGFTETEGNSAEDTDFNYKAVKNGARYFLAKDARVVWRTPDNFKEYINKIFSYAKWDSENGEWIHPVKGLLSHNLKVLLVFIRYIFGVFLLINSFRSDYLMLLTSVMLLSYFLWSFRKVFKRTKNIRSGVIGILVQIITDISVMGGFVYGMKHNKKIMQLISSFIFAIFSFYITVLFYRSLIHIKRIVSEFKYGVDPYYSDVVPCGDNNTFPEFDKQMLLRYRNIGQKCQE